MNKVKTYTLFRQNLAKTMDEVCSSLEPITVTRNNNEPVVMLSLKCYNSILETNYMLRSSRNAERLMASIKEIEALINKKQKLMEIVHSSYADEDTNYLKQNNKSIYKNILIEAINKNPYEGIGNPTPLKDELSEYWSRKIDSEHRLVYKIHEDVLYILQCRYHNH